MINVPWAEALSKYYLPSYTFAIASATIGLMLLYEFLHERNLRPPAWLWSVGAVVYMTALIHPQHLDNKNYYRKKYDYRKAVPLVAKDISDRLVDQPELARMCIVSRTHFYGEIQTLWFVRHKMYYDELIRM